MIKDRLDSLKTILKQGSCCFGSKTVSCGECFFELRSAECDIVCPTNGSGNLFRVRALVAKILDELGIDVEELVR